MKQVVPCKVTALSHATQAAVIHTLEVIHLGNFIRNSLVCSPAPSQGHYSNVSNVNKYFLKEKANRGSFIAGGREELYIEGDRGEATTQLPVIHLRQPYTK